MMYGIFGEAWEAIGHTRPMLARHLEFRTLFGQHLPFQLTVKHTFAH